jgi:hypothetical protein
MITLDTESTLLYVGHTALCSGDHLAAAHSILTNASQTLSDNNPTGALSYIAAATHALNMHAIHCLGRPMCDSPPTCSLAGRSMNIRLAKLERNLLLARALETANRSRDAFTGFAPDDFASIAEIRQFALLIHALACDHCGPHVMKGDVVVHSYCSQGDVIMSTQGGTKDFCRHCSRRIVRPRPDPWFHKDSGEERCERNGDLTDDFATPTQPFLILTTA